MKQQVWRKVGQLVQTINNKLPAVKTRKLWYNNLTKEEAKVLLFMQKGWDKMLIEAEKWEIIRW